MRLLLTLLISILLQTSCENDTSKHQIKEIDPIIEKETSIDSINQEFKDSTLVIPKTSESKDTSHKKKVSKQETKAINIEDAEDVNKYRNVRDDPDYIGTPCKMVNGECIRHDHKD